VLPMTYEINLQSLLVQVDWYYR